MSIFGQHRYFFYINKNIFLFILLSYLYQKVTFWKENVFVFYYDCLRIFLYRIQNWYYSTSCQRVTQPCNKMLQRGRSHVRSRDHFNNGKLRPQNKVSHEGRTVTRVVGQLSIGMNVYQTEDLSQIRRIYKMHGNKNAK